MPNDYVNPFDRPLDSEVSEHQQAHAATIAASDNGNPFNEPLLSEKAEAQQQATGQITNDVGNTVIVPKEGESFADTMKRAAAQGKKTTPQQINAELATAPTKAATVLAAAPAIGAAGAAALAAPGDIAGSVIEHLNSLDKIVKAAKALGYGSFGLKEAHDLYKMFSGDKK